jgi:hypothetical protein
MTTRSVRARSAAAFAATDDGAVWAFRFVMAVGIAVLFLVGRHQWFIRDDWALVITRDAVRQSFGWKDWLFSPQDGHWLTVPVLIYRGLQNVFGLESYLPFLLPVVLTHIAAVLLVRVLCRRCGVSPWTTTLVCAVLLVFGAGWENIVFAVQVAYNLSLVAFLAQVVLADHDGPPDRRDAVGTVLAVIGAMSSGFAPIFIAGIGLFLALRRRWLALAVAVVPQGLAYMWWYVFWQSDSTTAVPDGSKALVPAFVAQGLGSTMRSMVALPGLAGIALLGTLGVTLWKGTGWRVQSLLLTLWATAAVMLIGIGFQRVGFGVAYATTSRYQYMTAMLLAPALALAVDQLVRVSSVARLAARLVLAFAVVVNLGWLFDYGDKFAADTQAQKDTFELIVGSGLIDEAEPNHIPEPFSSDVTVRWLPWLVEHHVISPRTPANQAEIDHVRAALGLSVAAPTPVP